MPDLTPHRAAIRAAHLQRSDDLLDRLTAESGPDPDLRARAMARAIHLVEAIRGDGRPGLMEVFLAEYGLSTEEGVALMCLAEALLRVPDGETMDDLIEDKIAPSDWGRHLGQSSSTLVNASTWALMLTGRVLAPDAEPGVASLLRGAVRRLGEPVIRTAVSRAMREMGQQFVLGETVEEAVRRGKSMVQKGYSYSYDMLGEAAMTQADAAGYLAAYHGAIATLASTCTGTDIRNNPGISIKLSALHPRYEEPQRARVLTELVPVVLDLARAAKAAHMGLNIDAEEADRLELSLDVIEAVLRSPDLAGWDGFGVVVQAYGKRAVGVIDWLEALASDLDRRLMVRLVKGAYWDTEIKRAQVEGLLGFPVYTQKASTDVAYLCAARRLLACPRIYPQFATHNAHTTAAVLELAGGDQDWEFQRLHGMGESLHEVMRAEHGTHCRIYAPVGAHRDLLAYLVRRLLENGANSSFVNRIVDTSLAPAEVVIDPFEEWQMLRGRPARGVRHPTLLFNGRRNSAGLDLHDPAALEGLEAERADFARAQWQAGPCLAGAAAPNPPQPVENPAQPSDVVGQVSFASAADMACALEAARPWAVGGDERRAVLLRAADLYEAARGEFVALLAREAGKTLPDAISELREAVDFLRYYAGFAEDHPARGVIACISPWNFPLAIFTGQIAGALAAGNGVLAKPAESTSLIAHQAAQLLYAAGVPRTALQILPGLGPDVGAPITSDPRIHGVCFTGSTGTAQAIHRGMAGEVDPYAPLVAETGGLNAMIVDSTALPEQAVRDIVASAFQSAGQRCSALRILYIQEDVAERFLTMLKGAMDELVLGDPWEHATDVGPIITGAARDAIAAYIEGARILHRVPIPATGHFVAPTLIEVDGIAEMEREIFGPVLHVARFAAQDLDAVIDAVNAKGFGLTFGLHTRIDGRVEHVAARLKMGNLYVNRNQIGAVVGSQPFGGEGLSGTGPKAGGPGYVARLSAGPSAGLRPGSHSLPGPTGESNRLTVVAKGRVACLGPSDADRAAQIKIAQAAGCEVVPQLDAAIDVAVFDGDAALARQIRMDLAARTGPIVGLVRRPDLAQACLRERHVCVDTTASGGNAELLAATD